MKLHAYAYLIGNMFYLLHSMVEKLLNDMENMTVCLTMGQNILVDVIADQRYHRQEIIAAYCVTNEGNHEEVLKQLNVFVKD